MKNCCATSHSENDKTNDKLTPRGYLQVIVVFSPKIGSSIFQAYSGSDVKY